MILSKPQLLEVAHFINKGGRMTCQHDQTAYWSEREEFEALRENEQFRKSFILALHYEIQVDDWPDHLGNLKSHQGKHKVVMCTDVLDERSKHRIIAQRDEAFEDYEFYRRLCEADNDYLKFEAIQVKFL